MAKTSATRAPSAGARELQPPALEPEAAPEFAKLTVTIPKEEAEDLRRVANERRISITQAARSSFKTGVFVHKTLRDGGQILVRQPDGVIREVVFTGL